MNKILLFSFFVKIFSGRLDLEVEEHFCKIIQGTENFWNSFAEIKVKGDLR